MVLVPCKDKCPWCRGLTDMVLDGGNRVCRALVCKGTAGFHECATHPRAVCAPNKKLYVLNETGPMFCVHCNPMPQPK